MKPRFRLIACGLILFMMSLVIWTIPARAERPTRTIMLYMVGTDLETSRALATADLNEIARAAQGNADIRLVAYAGGANRWQSILSEGENGILTLDDGRWTLAESRPAENMCDPATLSAFLRDAVRRCPADSYALVLWNHGSGPMVGYGEDERFGGDKLTLIKLRQAFEDSPFASDMQLEWIGFDACLMGSMETAHAMSRYARYMVASQESEPNNGWNYGFLRDARGGESGDETGQRIIRSYLDGYAAEYKDYPEYAPKLTLSCLDLGMLEPAERALGALSECMARFISRNGYSELTRTRLNASAFGRFTTGSELDLVDLTDLVRGCDEMFPEQTQSVLDAIQNLVVYQDATFDEAGGVSIYFPFYNKDAYKHSWGQMYEQFGFCPGYAAFLKVYAGVWLGEQLAKWSDEAAPVVTHGTTSREFTMQLTPEQLDTYVSASYVILKRTEGQQYQFVSTGSDVTLDESGLLRANYDGKTLFCVDAATGDLGGTVLFREYERTETTVRYLVPGTLIVYAHDSILDVDNEWISVNFQIEYDRQSDETRILGIIPSAVDGISSGKQQLQQSEADHIYLINFDRYKARTEDGTLLPFDNWPSSDTARGFEFDTQSQGGAGVAFKMASADMGTEDLYLMLVVRDTQGNQTASDLLPVYEAPDAPEPTVAPPVYQTAQTVAFPVDSDQQTTLYDQDGIKVTLTGTQATTFDARLLMNIENHTGQPLKLRVDDGFVNDCRCSFSIEQNSALSSSWSSPVIEAGEALDVQLCVSIDNLQEMRLNHIHEIEFSLKFSLPDDYDVVHATGPLVIQIDWDLSDAVGTLPELSPGLIAPQQIELGDVRIQLLSSSMDSHNAAPKIRFLAENEGAYPVDLRIERVSADDYMMQETSLMLDPYGILPPGKRTFGYIYLQSKDLKRAGLTMPRRLEYVLRADLADTFQTLARSDVVSVDFVSPETGAYPEITVFDVDGVQVTIMRVDVGSEDGAVALFRAHVWNDSALDIQIKAGDGHLNDKPCTSLYLSPFEPILPGKRAVLDLEVRQRDLRNLDEATFDSLSLQFLMLDAERQELLRRTEEIPLAP